MNKINSKIHELKNYIFELDEVKNYFTCKEAVENNELLKLLNSRLMQAQKEMSINVNESNYDKLRNDYLKILQDMNNDPLVVNLRQSEEEVNILLNEIKDLLLLK